MELSELKTKICEYFTGSPKELQNILQIINQDQSVFPFNEFEYLICNLIEIDELTFQQYLDIKGRNTLMKIQTCGYLRYPHHTGSVKNLHKRTFVGNVLHWKNHQGY